MNSVNLNVSGVSTFSGTSNLDGDLRVGVSTLFADVSTGRVGVGTDVPGDLFFVDGSLTASGLSTFSGGISLKDNSKINLGTGNDAEIYFDSSNLYIKETTGAGDIYVESDDVYIRANGGGSTMAAFKSGAESILYHNGNAKATTDAGGIIITGIATASHFKTTGDIIVGGASTFANVTVTNNISITGKLTGGITHVTNIVGAAASIAGIVTATSFADSKGALRDIPLRSVTGSAATLVAADAGKVVSTNTTGWTVPASTFSEGDTVSLLNNSAGNLTITCSAVTTYWTSTGATVTSSTLGARGLATLYFVSASVAYLQGTSLS